MGTKKKQNSTKFIRCPKDEQHPFCRLPANLFKLNGHQLAIMGQLLSNNDNWIIVKNEIRSRTDFSREKFDIAWKSLIDLGYINVRRIQGAWAYTIYDNPSFTSTAGGICEDFTSTAGRHCAGGMLTTINNNYNRDFTTTADSTCYDDQFDELFEQYPSEGTREDGTTYSLKVDYDKCKKAYVEYLTTHEMPHGDIMKALQVELNGKRMTGNRHYQKGLLRWINEKDFEQYRGRALEQFELGYGQTLV